MKLKIELVGHLASNTIFTQTTANFCLLELVEKVADVKNGAGAKEALSFIAESCSLEFTSHKVREHKYSTIFKTFKWCTYLVYVCIV